MIQPKRRQILVEPIGDPDFYNPHSQLIKIPDQAKERVDQGIVKYVGSAVSEEVDPDITVGKFVIFSGYTGTTIGVDNELLILMDASFVKAIIEVDVLEVPGLYYKGRDGSYFPATYESALPLIARAFKEHIGGRLIIKKEEYIQQREVIDERSR